MAAYGVTAVSFISRLLASQWPANKGNCSQRPGIKETAVTAGLLTPAFVACSTNVGEGLVKLVTCSDIPGCVEEWHIPRKTPSK